MQNTQNVSVKFEVKEYGKNKIRFYTKILKCFMNNCNERALQERKKWYYFVEMTALGALELNT